MVLYKEAQLLQYCRIHKQLQYSNISNENRNDLLHGNSRYIRGWSLSEQGYINCRCIYSEEKIELYFCRIKILKMNIFYIY